MNSCYLLLCLFGQLSLEPLVADLVLKHVDLVLVVALNGGDHDIRLLFLLRLGLSEHLLFFEQFLLLQLGGQFIDLLSHAHLLSVAFILSRLLLVLQLLEELPLLYLLLFLISSEPLLLDFLLLPPSLVFLRVLMVVLFQQLLEFTLCFLNFLLQVPVFLLRL